MKVWRVVPAAVQISTEYCGPSVIVVPAEIIKARPGTVRVTELSVPERVVIQRAFARVTAGTGANALWITTLSGTDNSVTLTVPGRAFMISAGTTITLGPQYSVDIWTAAGTTRHTFMLIYEI